MQEGMAIIICENADDELFYKGVVYNEMRGAFSQATLNYTVFVQLFQIRSTNIFLVGCLHQFLR